MKILKKLTLLLSLCIPCALFAQSQLPDQHIQLNGGLSRHGTGDIKGIIFNAEYGRYFKKHLFWAIASGGSIHSGEYPLFFNDQTGNNIDGSIRYTTAGAQVTGSLGYSFIRTERHEIGIKLGALLRYQSSSYYDQFAILYPAATGYPTPLVSFKNVTPQKTFSIGGVSQVFYNYTIPRGISIGIHAGLQTDSNGDTITEAGLTLGKRYRHMTN